MKTRMKRTAVAPFPCLVALALLAVSAAPDSASAAAPRSAPAAPGRTSAAAPGDEQEVMCPDKEYSCHDGQTCCKLRAGGYGCCPMDKATCCLDGIHCCPHGTKCDVKGGRCKPKALSRNYFLGRVDPLMPIMEDNKVEEEAYSGDPLYAEDDFGGENILTEADNDYRENEELSDWDEYAYDESEAMSYGDELYPEVMPSKSAAVEDVTCPDSHSHCGNEQTCCVTKDGSYACCPMPDATCCLDRTHCCPSGTVCDVAGGRCRKKHHFWMLMSPHLSLKLTDPNPKIKTNIDTHSNAQTDTNVHGNPLKDVPCPDNPHGCADGMTCCQMKAKPLTYGCCPFANATCCLDGVDCCPFGTECVGRGGKCVPRETESTPLISLILANTDSPLPVERVKDVACPDNPHACADGMTCCQLKAKPLTYGCCPFANATCCLDGVDCCPFGTECVGRGGKCVPREESSHAQQQVATVATEARKLLPAESAESAEPLVGRIKVPAAAAATTTTSVKDILISCEDDGEHKVCPNSGGQICCKNTDTCCPNSRGEIGCCEIRDAVCCPDTDICCPPRYTCTVINGAGSCEARSLPPF